jgi:predicted TIM-barrel fold metal-dependent hydrolase
MTKITRRACLIGAAAMGVQKSLGAAGQGNGYIDSHVHLWTADEGRYPRSGPDRKMHYEPRSFTAEDLLKATRSTGVDRIILVQMNFFGYDNSYMLDAIATHNRAFRGIAVVDEKGKDVCKQMIALSRFGVSGFRIVSGTQGPHWLDSTQMSAMWSCAAHNALAMCVLIDPPALESVDRMCSKFPETHVVIDHLARIGMLGEVRDEDVIALCRLARHKNVYVKVSAFYALGQKRYPYVDLSGLIRRVYEAFGAARLMWGSDSPFQLQDGHTYTGSIELVHDKLSFLSDDDRDWLLRKTSESVLFRS